jgi:hypothetical protein
MQQLAAAAAGARTCRQRAPVARAGRARLGDVHVQVQRQGVAGLRGQRAQHQLLRPRGAGPELPARRLVVLPGREVHQRLCGQGQRGGGRRGAPAAAAAAAAAAGSGGREQQVHAQLLQGGGVGRLTVDPLRQVVG